MFKKVPYKVKVCIFIVLSLICMGIVIKTGVENYRTKRNIEIAKEKVEAEKKQEEANKLAELNRKAEEEAKRNQELQQKLEEKYNAAHDAFFSKKYKAAITLADEIIAQDSKFYKAYNIKGIALCYSTKKIEAGMTAIDKALEIKGDYGYARFNKALAYELFGHYEESLQWYDKDLEVEKYIWSYYGKASIYGRKGDVENTVKYLKIAIDMGPEVKALAKKETDFDNVRSSKEFQELIK